MQNQVGGNPQKMFGYDDRLITKSPDRLEPEIMLDVFSYSM